MTRALQELRVLDFSQLMAGPLATMLLADFGADVIKVEPPEGDSMRKTGGAFRGEDTVHFLSLNRNKRSIVVDLKSAEGQAAVRGLSRDVDVIVENFRPGVAERLGIGYEALKQDNERLIYCSISAFGRSADAARRPGMDPILQALSGMMSLSGNTQTGPLKLGIPFADLVVPLLATIGILVAVQARNATGLGQRVDLAMIEATIFGMVPRDSYYLATKDEPAGIGNEHNEIVPYNTFATKDGRAVMVIAHNDKFWRIIVRAVGADHLLADDRLATPSGRVRHRSHVNAELAAAFARRTLAEWCTILDTAEAMYAPVQSLAEVFAPAGIGREYVIDLGLSGGGSIELVRNPIHLSETPADIRRTPPRLGEHTGDILGPSVSPASETEAASAETGA